MIEPPGKPGPSTFKQTNQRGHLCLLMWGDSMDLSNNSDDSKRRGLSCDLTGGVVCPLLAGTGHKIKPKFGGRVDHVKNQRETHKFHKSFPLKLPPQEDSLFGGTHGTRRVNASTKPRRSCKRPGGNGESLPDRSPDWVPGI